MRFIRIHLEAILILLAVSNHAVADYVVSGRFMYRDRELDLTGFTGNEPDLPIRNADVQVLDVATDEVLASGSTDTEGGYTFPVSDAQVRNILIRCLTTSDATPDLFLTVRTRNGGEIYAVVSQIFNNHNPNENINAGTLLALPDLGGEAFNIFDNALNTMNFIQALEGSRPNQSQSLELFWDADAGRTVSFYNGLFIQLADDDGYDDTVILHETGHYVEDHFSRSASPGGQHFLGDNNQDIRLSWSEGWATFWASSVRKYMGVGNPNPTFYVDTTGQPGRGRLFFSYEIEGPSQPAIGATNEITVQALLWDIVDGEDSADQTPGVEEDFDRLALDFSRTWDVTTGYLTLGGPDRSNTSLEVFWDGLFTVPANEPLRQNFEDIFATLSVEYFDDNFESDDDSQSATFLATDGTPQHHTYYARGDEDFVSFRTKQGSRYIIETVNLVGAGDTSLFLINGDGGIIDSNDNRVSGNNFQGPTDPSSLIIFDAPADTTFFVRSVHGAASRSAYGSYDIRINEAEISGAALIDARAESGVQSFANGRSSSWGDYDGDGHLDLYIANSDSPNSLWKNNGDGSFANVTVGAGVGDDGSGGGAVWADYDNDADIDLYLVNFSGPNRLYENNGDGTFTDVAAPARVNDSGPNFGATWGDYNNDGNVDLYVVNFSVASILYRNNGNGTFTDVAASAGVENNDRGSNGIWGDYDNDGDVDLYVVNFDTANKLFRNDGNESFTDVTVAADIGDVGDGRGADWGDFDNDGDLDIYIANSGNPNVLYRNNSDGTFTDVAREAGVQNVSLSNNLTWGDYDNDGDLDLYLVNFFAPNVFYENLGNGAFTSVNNATDAGNGRSASFADYNGDGFLDLFLVNQTLNNQSGVDIIFENNGNSNHYIIVELVGTVSNRSGIGARVRVETGEKKQIREVRGGFSRGVQNSLPVEFGLGSAAQADEIEIMWPSGIFDLLTNVAANQILKIEEGAFELIRGDMNGDKIVNVTDLFRAIDIILGRGDDPTADELVRADCNRDGQINVRDLICIINVILNIG